MTDQTVLLMICFFGVIGVFIEIMRLHHKRLLYEAIMTICYKAMCVIVLLYSAYYTINRIMDFFHIKIIIGG